MIIILTIAIILLVIIANCNSHSGSLPNVLRVAMCKTVCEDGSCEENEWKSIAKCFDKFFFYFFSVVIVLLVLVFIFLFFAL